jgi:hypothetical protein
MNALTAIGQFVIGVVTLAVLVALVRRALTQLAGPFGRGRR